MGSAVGGGEGVGGECDGQWLEDNGNKHALPQEQDL